MRGRTPLHPEKDETMTKLYGSLVNRLEEAQVATEEDVPAVGDGATLYLHSDRHAFTVTFVGKKGRKEKMRSVVTIQKDKATRTDSLGMSDSQSYAYSRDPLGNTLEVTFRNGKWRAENGIVVFGKRDEYYDYSF